MDEDEDDRRSGGPKGDSGADADVVGPRERAYDDDEGVGVCGTFELK